MNDWLFYGSIIGSFGLMFLGWRFKGGGPFDPQYLIDAAVGALCAPLVLMWFKIELASTTTALTLFLLGFVAGIAAKVVARIAIKAFKAQAEALMAKHGTRKAKEKVQ